MERPKEPHQPKQAAPRGDPKRGFKRKKPRAAATAPADTLKEKVNAHIPMLKPGSISELVTFKARLMDHLRAEFTFNGNMLSSACYYTGEDTLVMARGSCTF